MRPSPRHIDVTRGDTFRHLVTFVDPVTGDPVDLGDNVYAAQLRDNPDADEVLATIDCTVADPTLGAVWLTIDATVTATLAPGRVAWDLEETDGAGAVTTILGGTADIVADVTKAVAP